jgi:hypothetical protein
MPNDNWYASDHTATEKRFISPAQDEAAALMVPQSFCRPFDPCHALIGDATFRLVTLLFKA